MQRNEYSTRQREQIMDYLSELADAHVTADELMERLCLGKATVYRTLDRLVQQNVVRRYQLGGRQGACYQYVTDDGCHHHFHLKCVGCGRLIHVECQLLDQTSRHIAEHHDFEVDQSKTVFYGLCRQCSDMASPTDQESGPSGPCKSGK